VGELQVTRVSERVAVFTYNGDSILDSFGANCTAVIGQDAAALIDPLIALSSARAVEAALALETGIPVRYVLLSHHHTDHALGAGLFARRGIPVLCHRGCRERMADEHPALVESRRQERDLATLFADADPYVPQVFFESKLELDLGGVTVVAIHPGHSHTPGDSFFYVPEEHTAIAGDLVSVGYHVNYEHADPSRLAEGLARFASLFPAVVVPGHGPVSDSSVVESQRAYHEEISRINGEGARAGRPPRDVVEAIRRRYPGYLLDIVLPETVARLSSASRNGVPGPPR